MSDSMTTANTCLTAPLPTSVVSVMTSLPPSLDDLITTTTSGYSQEPLPKGEIIKFSVNFKKQNYDMQFGNEETAAALKQSIAQVTGVPPQLQKLMLKGLVKDDHKTLSQLNIVNGSKLMLIGSTVNEVVEVSTAPASKSVAADDVHSDLSLSKESLSEIMPHKRIVEKGIPEEAIPSKKGKHDTLPTTPLVGIYNNVGIKVRLTFKMWSQELWIQSASSTQKIPFVSVRKVTSEPIKGNESYHIVALQLGNSEIHKYYLYFVPCQYVRAIKNVFGTF